MRRAGTLVLASAALLLAGCGGSDDGSGEASTTPVEGPKAYALVTLPDGEGLEAGDGVLLDGDPVGSIHNASPADAGEGVDAVVFLTLQRADFPEGLRAYVDGEGSDRTLVLTTDGRGVPFEPENLREQRLDETQA